MKSSSPAKSIALLNLVLITASCSVALATPPADGYEISIYDAFPPHFWILILLPIVTPFLMSMQRHCKCSKRLWFIHYWSAAASLLLFLSLPLVRGYAFYSGGDSLTHLGLVKDLLSSGHIGTTNFYPIIHIWVYALSDVSGTNPTRIMLYTPQFFTLFYTVSVFLLARVLKPGTALPGIAVSLALMPIFGAYHVCVFPSSEAFFLIPFAMYLLICSRRDDPTNSFSFSISYVILMIVFPFFHPETALFFLFIIITMHCSARFSRMAQRCGGSLFRRLGGSSTPILILVAAFGIWFLTSLGFGGTIKIVYESFVSNSGQALVSQYAESIDKAGISFAQLLGLLFRVYGASLAFMGLAATSTVIMIVRVGRKTNVDAADILISTTFTTLLPISAVFLLKDLIIGDRTIKYLLFMSTIAASSLALSLSNRGFRTHSRGLIDRLPCLAISAIIVTSATVTVLTAYPSPIEIQANWQITQQEFSGMSFYFDHRNPNLQTMEIATSQMRFKDALFGVEYSTPNIRYGNMTHPITHFGYDTASALGSHYDQNQYLLLNGLSKLLYPETYAHFPNSWLFTPDDFEKLDNDSSTNLVFCNGDFEIYQVLSD